MLLAREPGCQAREAGAPLWYRDRVSDETPAIPYDYARRDGVRLLSWDDFEALGRRLAEVLAARKVDAVLGVARGGLFPATLVSCALRCELYPSRISRRSGDEVVHDTPVWRVPVTAAVEGKSVAVIDDVSDTGQTLELVRHEVRRLGASRVITAALVAHTWSQPPPDVAALTSDELVVFPWDREVLIDGAWQPHPELVTALRQLEADGK